ncbi:MAG: hypothetical protein AAF215_13865 [Cyanobacteria bacterium P01_A01_bin.123]
MAKIQDQSAINADEQAIRLLLIIPVAGLIYCGLVIFAIAALPTLREHPLFAGAFFSLLPLTVAAFIWLSTSARAYRKLDN